ncbi:oligogalacturonate lyase family protein [Halostagnicola bangensis]
METILQQGPKAGRHWPAEAETYEDPITGTTVRRFTNYPNTTNRHLYFTEPAFYDDGRRLLFRSDRDGSRDLYSVDLESGLLTQLTDLPQEIDGTTRFPDRNTALFWCGRRLVSLDLETLEIATHYERPEGYYGGHLGGTADGTRAVVALSEALDLDDERDPENREVWMNARMEAGPRSKVISVPIEDGSAEPSVHVDTERWLTHVNTSPTKPELITYCEEGPWEEADRIWGLNLETDETWQVRPTDADEAVGHEHWLADGEHVGYHGWRGSRDDPDAFFGQVRYDGTDRREWPAPDIYTHFHSITRDLIVGDGTHRGIPHLLLWRWDADADGYDGPWALATHDWTGDDDVHPHGRLSPDGSRIAFDSSRGGNESDVYVVDVPDDLEDLPRLEDFEVVS